MGAEFIYILPKQLQRYDPEQVMGLLRRFDITAEEIAKNRTWIWVIKKCCDDDLYFEQLRTSIKEKDAAIAERDTTIVRLKKQLAYFLERVSA